MGYAEGDPDPCTGLEPAAPVLRLDENGDPAPSTAMMSSACFADWYLGPGKWVWRDGDPSVPPADEPPADPGPTNQ